MISIIHNSLNFRWLVSFVNEYFLPAIIIQFDGFFILFFPSKQCAAVKTWNLFKIEPPHICRYLLFLYHCCKETKNGQRRAERKKKVLTETRRALQPKGTQWFPWIGLFVVKVKSWVLTHVYNMEINTLGTAVEGLGTIQWNGLLVHNFLPNRMIFFHLSPKWFSDL